MQLIVGGRTFVVSLFLFMALAVFPLMTAAQGGEMQDAPPQSESSQETSAQEPQPIETPAEEPPPTPPQSESSQETSTQEPQPIEIPAEEPAPASPPTVSPRAEFVQFPGGDLTLGGFIWKPTGDGPFPTVLYNHGSEKLPGSKPELGGFFVNNGYAFFVPHRRGHGRSPGPYIQDQLAQAPVADRGRLQVELLQAQVADQLAGLTYLRGTGFVDPNRTAVAGCSYGGIQTTLGADANPGYRAAVNFAGAAQSWAGNPLLRQRMIQAIQRITIPIFLLQAENDYDIQPSLTLAAELQRLGKAHAVKIFPPFGTTRDDGHGGFCERGASVWGPDLLQFLNQHVGR